MKFLKTHYGRAIKVIPSDTVDIPNPAGLGKTGTATSGTDLTLEDSTANFTTNLFGAIVVNNTTGESANVVGLVDSTTLKLDAGIFAGGDLYSIYSSKNNEGCSLYIPAQTPGTLSIITIGGDYMILDGCGDLNSHTVLPICVSRVLSGDTTLTNLVAIW